MKNIVLITLFLFGTIAYAVMIHQKDSNNAETIPEELDNSSLPSNEPDLYCTTYGTVDGGMNIQAFKQADGSYQTTIRPVSFAGLGPPIFEGKLYLFKVKGENGQKIFELRDSENNSNTVIRLVENGNDRATKINGKSTEGDADLSCVAGPVFIRDTQKI